VDLVGQGHRARRSRRQLRTCVTPEDGRNATNAYVWTDTPADTGHEPEIRTRDLTPTLGRWEREGKKIEFEHFTSSDSGACSSLTCWLLDRAACYQQTRGNPRGARGLIQRAYSLYRDRLTKAFVTLYGTLLRRNRPYDSGKHKRHGVNA
jgi:hypothetical protein